MKNDRKMYLELNLETIEGIREFKRTFLANQNKDNVENVLKIFELSLKTENKYPLACYMLEIAPNWDSVLLKMIQVICVKSEDDESDATSDDSDDSDDSDNSDDSDDSDE